MEVGRVRRQSRQKTPRGCANPKSRCVYCGLSIASSDALPTFGRRNGKAQKFLSALLPTGSRPVKVLEYRAGGQTRTGVMSLPCRSIARTNRMTGEVFETGPAGVPIEFEGMAARMLQLATCSP